MLEGSHETIDDKVLRDGPCPPGVCDCDYYTLTTQKPPVSESGDGVFEVSSTLMDRHGGLTITKKEIIKTIKDIEEITTIERFERVRNDIRERFTVIFRLEGGSNNRGGPNVRMEVTRGLCRKTREKFRVAIRDLLIAREYLHIQILNKGSLFPEEGE